MAIHTSESSSFRAGSNQLKSRIKSCLDASGTLIAVLFGSDNPEPEDGQTIQKIVEELQLVDSSYVNPKIEVWRQNQIRGYLSQFPSLALRVTGRDSTRLQSHKSWSLQDDMLKEFEEGEKQREFVESLQELIRSPASAVHVRIWGEAGVGKTKLALEASRSEDLAPLVVYCDAASKFRDSDLMNELLRDDNSFSVILVVDECDPDARSYIWNKFKHLGNRIRLISVYDEFDPTSGDIAYMDAPPLEKNQIARILQSYDLPEDQAERWADLCSGSPRVAHVIGHNLKNNPEDLLKPLDTVNVWTRFIEGAGESTALDTQQRTLVLKHVALFKRFGYGASLVNEAKMISSLVHEADPNITWSRFQEIVSHLRNRRILQGENTLYITPRALHIWLWGEWWRTYGDSFEYVKFSESLMPQLMQWFNDMFRYGAGFPGTSRVVAHLLGPDGPFKDTDFLRSPVGADFFLRLSEADPKAALAYLKKTLGSWDKQTLLQFSGGRRQVVWALQNIAVWKDLFTDAAMLLLALGEAENEVRISNNASGVFASLFAIGPGRVASTEAAPASRWQILEDALLSRSIERQRLAIEACNVALETRNWHREGGRENQGIRRSAQLWAPQTYGELWDAYRHVWTMLVESLDTLPADLQQHAMKVLLVRARGLSIISGLSSMVVEDIRNLTVKPYADTKEILTEVLGILHYEDEELAEEAKRDLEQLRDDLAGDDFGSLLKRFVGMDLLVDKFDDQGNHVDQVQPKLSELAEQAMSDDTLLHPELNWLVTGEAENGFRFGYELGRRDANARLLTQIVQNQRVAGPKGALYFLGGYLRALREIDEEQWEEKLDELTADTQSRHWIPELSLRSGNVTDRSAVRILSLIQSNAIPITQLRLFAFGGVTGGISQELFMQWIKHLLSISDDSAVSIALDLFAAYYRDSSQHGAPPRELTLQLLTHDSLFQPGPSGRLHSVVYDFLTIGKQFLVHYPEDSLSVAEEMLDHLGEDGTIVEGFHSEARTLLNDITRRFPTQIWSKVAELLGPPIDTVAYHIALWLRGDDLFRPGHDSMIEVFQAETIWEWVTDDPNSRAWYLATIVPPTLFSREGSTCLARELLMRFGGREDVRRNLQANFSTGGWTGSLSSHFRAKKDALLGFRASEDDQNVIQWIEEYVGLLDLEITRALIAEEREEE